MTRPRAADDFATIRVRIEELRRERSAEEERRTAAPQARGSEEPRLPGRGAAAASEGRWLQRSRLTGLPRR